MSKKIEMSIIVLNWNRLHYSKQTISCILSKTNVPYELILVDNNSSDDSGVREYLESIIGKDGPQDVRLLFNNKNLGVAGGRNEGLRVARGKYLVTIDDDVLVPDDWDIQLKSICDNVSNIGITGVNVEPIKYPVQVINGVRLRPKIHGNLGGACLCIPKRILDKVGYYRVFGQYGLEDSDFFVRLKTIGLLSAYIEKKGVHLDNDSDKVYRKVKNRAHQKGSAPLSAFAQAKAYYAATKNVYVPYEKYDPDDKKWENFESMDGTISARLDNIEILNMFPETRGILKIGKRIDMVKDGDNARVDVLLSNNRVESRKASVSTVNKMAIVFIENNDNCVNLIRDGVKCNLKEFIA